MVSTRRLGGVVPALITPVSADGSIDHATLGQLVERAADAGVDGFAPGGSTGEGRHLAPETRHAVLRTVVTHAPGDLPIIAWVPASTLDATLQELQRAADAGATTALLAPPVGGHEQGEFLSALARRTPLDLVVYNIPAITGVAVEKATIDRVADHPRVIGIKDSTRDMETLQRWIWSTHDAENFAVLTGTDSLLVASVLTGASGTIAASPGILPHLAVDIHRAVRDDDLHRAWARQRELAEIVDLCRAHPFPAGWKAAAHLLGLGTGLPLPPREPLDEQAMAELGRRLDEFPSFLAAQRGQS